MNIFFASNIKYNSDNVFFLEYHWKIFSSDRVYIFYYFLNDSLPDNVDDYCVNYNGPEIQE